MQLIRGVMALCCVLFSTTAYAQIRRIADQPPTRFGILYTGWHCRVVQPDRPQPFNIAEALAGKRPWGPIPEFHFWAEPKEGYYCLTDRPDILRRHAEMLRDAGIDFIVFDATNNELTGAPTSSVIVMEPFRKLLDVWSAVPGAPKVVPWAPLTRKGDMLEWLAAKLTAASDLQFNYKGKPLILITQHELYATDEAKAANLARSYTVRTMWSRMRRADHWSFLSQCQKGFREAGGQRPCRQPITTKDGIIEQISIATAYQETYMSLKATATPKFHGRTFVRQFETLQAAPEAAIAVISGWNEWMAQRFCLNSSSKADHQQCSSSNDHWPDGRKIFVDQYDAEYNRDIEPSKDWPGDFYYRLMVNCISKFRARQKCTETDVPLSPPSP